MRPQGGLPFGGPYLAFNSTSRESFIYRATVIEARYYKGMNKGRCSSWGEGAGHHPKLPKLVVTAAAKKINMPDKCKLLVKGYSQVTDRGREGEVGVFNGKGPKVYLSELLTSAEPDELCLGWVKPWRTLTM